MYKRMTALAMAGLILQGCSTVPLGSIPKLARIDFMTTDLSHLRVAIALPLALAPKPQGVVMEMKYRVGEEPEQQEDLHLVEVQSTADKAGLPSGGDHAEALFVFRLSAEDVAKLDGLRIRVTEAKARREKGSLGLGIAAKEFCKISNLPDGPALTTTYVLTSENDGYVTISRDFDLRSDAKVADGLAKLEYCH